MAGLLREALGPFVEPLTSISTTFTEMGPAVVQALGDISEIKAKMDGLLGGSDPRKVIQQSKMTYEAGFSNECAVYFIRPGIIELLQNFQCGEKEIGFIANTLLRYSNLNDSFLDWTLWVTYRIWNAVKAIFKISDWQIMRRMVGSKLEDMLLKDANSRERKFAVDLKSMDMVCEVAAEIFLMQALNVNRGSQHQFDHQLWLNPLEPKFKWVQAPEEAKAKASAKIVKKMEEERVRAATPVHERRRTEEREETATEGPPPELTMTTPSVEGTKQRNAVGAWFDQAGEDISGFFAALGGSGRV